MDVFEMLLAWQEVSVLGYGHSKSSQCYVLPAGNWASKMDEVYGPEARAEPERHITRRQLRDESVAAKVVMDQVDVDGNLHWFAVVRTRGTDLAYVVPRNKALQAIVEPDGAEEPEWEDQ